MSLTEQATRNAAEFARQYRELTEAGVEFLQTHVVDINGNLRSKISPLKLSPAGDVQNGILYCVSHGDGQPGGDTAFDSAIANEANGFPNIASLMNPDTLRQHGWRPDMASGIASGYMLDGSLCEIDPRHVLERADKRLRALGYEARVALEYEFGIFHADPALTQSGRHRELKPWGQSLVNYDLVRGGDYQDLVTEFIRRLKSVGIGLSSFVTEYGFGMYEYALTPKPALEAADDAVRAKLHLRELCAERGLIATFMTRFQPPGRESACGAHHHISLWQDDKPVLGAGLNQLSGVGQQFLAGMLAHLPETHVIYRPTINSYRRFDANAWSPTSVSWGYENRTAAIRAITTPSAAAARFEHRVPGADINPYLTVAAMVAAGAAGIEAAMVPPAAEAGMPVGAPALPNTLAASTEAFEASEFCAEAFGSAFCTHYALSRRNEIAAFERWMSERITDFEWQRYF